ncbi:ArgR family transcriptional regulator [candidate division KSB1 bacterium]|nr:ArgR family transcriptional regulator [candidate division KSB1 bacterium]
MKDRKQRHIVICEIIKDNKIASQMELQSMLDELGYTVTQATLSRDLAALKVMKRPDPIKGHIYAISDEVTNPFTVMNDNSPLNACRQLSFAGNLAVIKCLPSFAPSIALLLDGLEMDEVIGTVAGDDTILVVLRDGISHEQFRRTLLRRLPELRRRF